MIIFSLNSDDETNLSVVTVIINHVMCDAQDLVVFQVIVVGDFGGKRVGVGQLGKFDCWKSSYLVTLPIPFFLLAHCIPLSYPHLKRKASDTYICRVLRAGRLFDSVPQK